MADCKGDTKKLYNLVYGLMGKEKSSPLPDHADEESLANDFTDYFMSKIEKNQRRARGLHLIQTPRSEHKGV